MSPALTPADRTRLVALLGMLGSDHAGERANAGSLATRLVRERGLTWGDVVPPALPPPPPRPAQPAPTQCSDDLAFCARYPERLEGWALDFVISLGRQGYPLTPKQKAKLSEIAGRLRRGGCL